MSSSDFTVPRPSSWSSSPGGVLHGSGKRNLTTARRKHYEAAVNRTPGAHSGLVAQTDPGIEGDHAVIIRTVMALAGSPLGNGRVRTVGKGVSGTAVLVRQNGKQVVDRLPQLPGGMVGAVRGAARPRADEDVVVKFMFAEEGRLDKNRADVRMGEFRREVAVLGRLAAAPATTVGGHTFQAAPYTPRLYLAGILPRFDAMCIVMSVAPGTELKKLKALPPTTVATIEHAFISMWLAGVAHTDAHGANVMVDTASSPARVTIIDFGRAVTLSAATVAAFKRRFVGLRADVGFTLADISQDIESAAGLAAEKRFKNYGGFFYANTRMVARVLKKCTACDGKKLDDARRAIWAPQEKKTTKKTNDVVVDDIMRAIGDCSKKPRARGGRGHVFDAEFGCIVERGAAARRKGAAAAGTVGRCAAGKHFNPKTYRCVVVKK